MDLRDHGKEYAVPDDNPFVNDPSALPEIYAYGFAQPWKCSVDRGDPGTREGAGRIFCGDIGIADAYEEVNLVVKGGNYGYPIFEGDKCLTDNQTCSAGNPILICLHNHPLKQCPISSSWCYSTGLCLPIQ